MLVINGLVFDWEARAQDVDPEVADSILRELRVQRIYAQADYWLKHQSELPTPQQFQAKIAELAAAFVYSDIQQPDPLHDEALSIAEDLIVKALARDNLPPPRNLREHAAQLMQQHGEHLLGLARSRIEARATLVHDSIVEMKSTANTVDVDAL